MQFFMKYERSIIIGIMLYHSIAINSMFILPKDARKGVVSVGKSLDGVADTINGTKGAFNFVNGLIGGVQKGIRDFVAPKLDKQTYWLKFHSLVRQMGRKKINQLLKSFLANFPEKEIGASFYELLASAKSAHSLQELHCTLALIDHVLDKYEVSSERRALIVKLIKLLNPSYRKNKLHKYVSRGMELASRDPHGRSILHVAAQYGDKEITEEVLLLGLKNNQAFDIDGDTPLHYASDCGKPEIIEILCKDATTDVNCRDSHALTPLHLAIFRGAKSCVLKLLSYGADPNLKGYFKVPSPLHYAADKGEKQLIPLLIENGARPFSFSCGKTPLHYAAKKGHFIKKKQEAAQAPIKEAQQAVTSELVLERDCVQLFIAEYKLDPAEQSFKGKTVLHYLAQHPTDEVQLQELVNEFLSRELLLTKDFNKRTALHSAAVCKNLPYCRVLLGFANGLDKEDAREVLEVRDNYGKRALDYAIESRASSVIKFFIDEMLKHESLIQPERVENDNNQRGLSPDDAFLSSFEVALIDQQEHIIEKLLQQLFKAEKADRKPLSKRFRFMTSKRFEKFIKCALETGNVAALQYALDFYYEFQKGLRKQKAEEVAPLLVSDTEDCLLEERSIAQLVRKLRYNLEHHEYNALQYAAHHGHVEIIKIMLEIMSPLLNEIENPENERSPLKLACAQEHESVATVLRNYGKPAPQIQQIPVIGMYLDYFSDALSSVPGRTFTIIKERPRSTLTVVGALFLTGVAVIIF